MQTHKTNQQINSLPQKKDSCAHEIYAINKTTVGMDAMCVCMCSGRRLTKGSEKKRGCRGCFFPLLSFVEMMREKEISSTLDECLAIEYLAIYMDKTGVKFSLSFFSFCLGKVFFSLLLCFFFSSFSIAATFLLVLVFLSHQTYPCTHLWRQTLQKKEESAHSFNGWCAFFHFNATENVPSSFRRCDMYWVAFVFAFYLRRFPFTNRLLFSESFFSLPLHHRQNVIKVWVRRFGMVAHWNVLWLLTDWKELSTIFRIHRVSVKKNARSGYTVQIDTQYQTRKLKERIKKNLLPRLSVFCLS